MQEAAYSIASNIERNNQGNNVRKGMIFHGSNENVMDNGRCLLMESVSLFNGKTYPIRCLSVDELNTTFVDWNYYYWSNNNPCTKLYKSVWEGRAVLVKLFSYPQDCLKCCREIVVATQMSIHKNSHKLLACSLETSHPVLIYEFVENGFLKDRILRDKNRNNTPLEWRDRLRIAWEISHAIAYLHSAFPRPIIHRDLRCANIFLEEDNATKLSGFTLSISIPEGKTHVEDVPLIGTFGYVAPERFAERKVAEKADVYSFGIIFLVLLTGFELTSLALMYFDDSGDSVNNWVCTLLKDECICDFVDPAINTNKLMAHDDLEQQLRASMNLVLGCIAKEEESRPTMVDVATESRT